MNMNERKRFQILVPRAGAEQAAHVVCRRANDALTRAVVAWSGVDACRRAHEVAMHYRDAMVNGRRAPDVDLEPWTRAACAPDLRWHGTRNIAPRAFTDDADRQRVTARHLKVLLARERECADWNEADRDAREVALHYRFKNAPGV